MTRRQKIALGYFVALLGAAALNYIPGVKDAQGRAFGVFTLDIFDDVLHLASALWALGAAVISRRAATAFLIPFGALYLVDGVMGLALGSGYLDLGIFSNGILDLPLGLKILANTPHILLGGFALIAGTKL